MPKTLAGFRRSRRWYRSLVHGRPASRGAACQGRVLPRLDYWPAGAPRRERRRSVPTRLNCGAASIALWTSRACTRRIVSGDSHPQLPCSSSRWPELHNERSRVDLANYAHALAFARAEPHVGSPAQSCDARPRSPQPERLVTSSARRRLLAHRPRARGLAVAAQLLFTEGPRRSCDCRLTSSYNRLSRLQPELVRGHDGPPTERLMSEPGRRFLARKGAVSPTPA